MSQTDDATQGAFVAWLRDTAVSVDDDDALVALVDGARVIALGEPGHGAHEPLAFRNQLIRLYVERRQIAAVVLETGCLEARVLDAYVTGGSGDPETLVRDNMSWGFGELAANVELLRWLRDRNAGAIRPIRLYGADLPGGDGRGDISRGAIAPGVVAALLRRSTVDGALALAASLDDFGAQLTRPQVLGLDTAGRGAIADLLERTDGFLTVHADALAVATSIEERDWAVRAAVMSRGLFDMFCLWPDVPAGARELRPEAVEAMLEASTVRDAAMAGNVLWLLDRIAPDQRLLLFAANGHVIGGTHVGGLWRGHEGLGLPAGRHLRSLLGNAYRVVVSVSDGPLEGPVGSVETLLSLAGHDRALFDLRHAPPASAWLDQAQSVGTNAPYEQAFVPRTSFDAAVYFRRLSRAAATTRPPASEEHAT